MVGGPERRRARSRAAAGAPTRPHGEHPLDRAPGRPSKRLSKLKAHKRQRRGVWQPSPVLPSSVAERLDRLAPDQREAATAPPGPVLCVAPAGSGKTTTLVARIAWLVATGADPAAITAVTFNKRAADEMAARVDAALEPLGFPPGSVRAKTFHALGREILADGGERVEPLLDRETVLRDMWPDITRGAVRQLDDAFSRLKLEIDVTAREVATDPEPGPVARAFLAYEQALAEAGGLDFDDLVARSVRLLEARPPLLRRWRAKCEHMLVDKMQDVDRTQLRLALLLAAPSNRIFGVGDDDQSYSTSLPVRTAQLRSARLRLSSRLSSSAQGQSAWRWRG